MEVNQLYFINRLNWIARFNMFSFISVMEWKFICKSLILNYSIQNKIVIKSMPEHEIFIANRWRQYNLKCSNRLLYNKWDQVYVTLSCGNWLRPFPLKSNILKTFYRPWHNIYVTMRNARNMYMDIFWLIWNGYNTLDALLYGNIDLKLRCDALNIVATNIA